HLELIGRSLKPYVLGARYSIADVYLYMLASWYPGGKEDLYARLPPLRQHAQALSLRPALSRVEADHAGGNRGQSRQADTSRRCARADRCRPSSRRTMMVSTFSSSRAQGRER